MGVNQILTKSLFFPKASKQESLLIYFIPAIYHSIFLTLQWEPNSKPEATQPNRIPAPDMAPWDGPPSDVPSILSFSPMNDPSRAVLQFTA